MNELKTCCWYWPSLRLCVLRERIALSTSVTFGFLTNKLPIYVSQLEHRSLDLFNLGTMIDCLSREIDQHRSVNPSFFVFDSFDGWRITRVISWRLREEKGILVLGRTTNQQELANSDSNRVLGTKMWAS